jgi:hypothetical protein
MEKIGVPAHKLNFVSLNCLNNNLRGNKTMITVIVIKDKIV